jgi:hypothetical protein
MGAVVGVCGGMLDSIGTIVFANCDGVIAGSIRLDFDCSVVQLDGRSTIRVIPIQA